MLPSFIFLTGFYTYILYRFLKRYAKCHQLHYHTCLLWGCCDIWLKLKSDPTTENEVYLFYLSNCPALEHCHQPHQKNLASPSCALWRRSRLESGKETYLNTNVNTRKCIKNTKQTSKVVEQWPLRPFKHHTTKIYICGLSPECLLLQEQ